jgi:aminopeptidase N
MFKYTHYLLALLILASCNSSKKLDKLSSEFDFYSENIDSSDYTEEWDESEFFDYGDGEDTYKVRPIYNSSRTLYCDLIHTKLEVNFDWEKARMNGKATISAKPHFYATDSIVLDAKGMDIKKVQMEGKELTFNYIDSLQLHIKLGKTFTRNDKFTLVIDYVAKPNERKTAGSAAITSDKGLYFINHKRTPDGAMPQIWTQGETEANSVWFPTIDAPNAKTSQEILITVEDKYLTLSNGKMIASKKNTDGTRTDHWKQDLPHAPYLFMMAIGEFKVVKDTYKRPDGSLMEVNYFVEPEFEQNARAIFGETPRMIAFFSKVLGVEYPWDKYHQIVVRDYVSGAMENTGAVIFGDFVYKTDRELLDGNDQSTIAHELFHHWFGDLVTCESWANLPLNESFANYSQYLWDEHRYGLEEADYQAEEEAEGYFNSAQNTGYNNLIRFDYLDKEDMFDGHSYNKGGRILHILRNYLGDEAFFAGLNNYLTTNKYKAAEVHHLRLAFEEVSGEDLNWFFNQWFLGKGHPIVFTEQTKSEDGKTVYLKIKQHQNIEDFPIYRMPVDVAIWDNNGKRTQRIIIDSLEQSFAFAVNGELKNLLFDAPQALMGKYYEEKSNQQFIHQFYNSNRYRAKKTALFRLRNFKGAEIEKMYMDAINDGFWATRIEGIRYGAKAVKNEKEAFIQKVKDLAVNDPKSQVRAEAIQALEFLEIEDILGFLKGIMEKEQSYLVLGNILSTIAEIDVKEALIVARKMEKDNVKSMFGTIAEIYAGEGEKEDAPFFENVLRDTKISNQDQVRAFISYMIFSLRMDLDQMDKLYSMFAFMQDNGKSYVNMYFNRIVQYVLNDLQNKEYALAAEIEEMEKAKAFGQADLKKKERQRVEDLLNNFSGMLVEEDFGDY